MASIAHVPAGRRVNREGLGAYKEHSVAVLEVKPRKFDW